MSQQGSDRPFEAGVLKSLVDFSFAQYATPRLIRILYAISFVVIASYGLIFFIGGLTEGGLFAFLALIGAPIFVLLALIYARVLSEIMAVLFRLGENTSRIVAMMEHRGGGPSAGHLTGPPGGPAGPVGLGGPVGPGGSGAPGGPPPSPAP